MRHDRTSADAAPVSLARRLKSLRRGVQRALTRIGLAAAARAIRLEPLARACGSSPPLDVVLLADGDRGGSTRAAEESLTRQVLPVGPIRLVHRSPSLPLLEGVRHALARGAAPLVAIGDAAAAWEDDAALWIAMLAGRHPAAKAIYADHVEAGRPVCKPDFSWTYLLARDFVGPVVVYDRGLVVAAVEAILAAGRQPATPAAAAYAIALEALGGRRPGEIVHVRHPLWHAARAEPPPTGLAEEAAAALGRRGVVARVSCRGDDPRLHDVRLSRSSAPLVSIVIPTKNAGDLVEKCIADLRATAASTPHEIVVIDHESDEPRLAAYLGAESAAGRLRVFPYRGPFNYAAMNNAAVRQVRGELVLLLNNDVDGFAPGWLDQMVATFELDPAIAAVGGLLLYPDGAIQHAGVILTPKRPCVAAHSGLPGDAPGYEGRVRSLQEFSAVTAACMLVRRTAFEQVGGFDEIFPDDYNDIDLCLRLRQAGFKIVYNPLVRASHWESKSRRPKETGKDLYRSRWRDAIAADPFYSPHLSPTEFRPDDLAPLWRERKRVALRAAVRAAR